MTQKQVLSGPKQIADEIIALVNEHASEDYNGESISQTSHMIQCGMLAMGEGEIELTIGAFLHDIGRLLKYEYDTDSRSNFGVVKPERIGAVYLRKRGFSHRICAIVANHMAAKRYLVATDETYASKLSAVSKETLKWQGGRMTEKEAKIFKSHSFFEDIIKVTLWDEKADNANVSLLPISFFHKLIYNYIKDNIE